MSATRPQLKALEEIACDCIPELVEALRVAISMVGPENSYRYLEIRDEAVEIKDTPDLDFISSMAKKYVGRDRHLYHRPGDEHAIVHVEPGHTMQMG